MRLGVIGINHQKADIDRRERMHFKESGKIDTLNRMYDAGVTESAVLSTCNRSEIYFMSNDMKQSMESVKGIIEEYSGLEVTDEYFFMKEGKEALEHLFRVTMGLESIVPGEDQILGQVRDALETSMEAGFSGKALNKVMREAITFSKYIKSDSNVSYVPTSIAYLGISILGREIGLKGKKCLVVGAGSMGKLAASYLVEAGALVYISNRTYENSVKLKDVLSGIEIVPYEDIRRFLMDVDVLVTATSSPHVIFKKSDIAERTRPLEIMDLSLPRDVSTDVTEVPMVTLKDIDYLEGAQDANLNEKRQILISYLPMMYSKINELEKWLEDIRIDPVLKSSSRRCEEIADDTLSYIYRKTTLKEGEKKKVDKIVRSSINKVMKEVLVTLKQMPEGIQKENVIEFLQGVFNPEVKENS